MAQMTVIVPVYNVESLLPLCLDSIRKQSLGDIEIVCVNDGSTDRSGAILELFAEIDPRIIVVNQENRGVSAARNAGIKIASSPYLCFVDADDCLLRNACEVLFHTLDSSGADVVKCSARVVPELRETPWHKKTLTLESGVFEGFSKEVIFEKPSRPFPWNGAYRTAFLKDNGIVFPEGLALGEDQVFAFSTLARSSRTIMISDCLYEYLVERGDSAMSSFGENYIKKLESHERVVSEILRDWSAGGYIERAYEELLGFVNDFHLVQLCVMPPCEDKKRLLGSFRCVLREHFDAGEVAKKVQNKYLSSAICDLLQFDGSLSTFDSSRVWDLYAGSFGQEAAKAARKAANRSRFSEKVKAIFKKVWPLPARSMVRYLDYERECASFIQRSQMALEFAGLERDQLHRPQQSR